MNKEKREEIKNKIRPYIPAVLAITSIAVGAALVAKTLKTPVLELKDYRLPTITGDEKAEVLARTDTILQQIEPDLYYLSVGVTLTED